MTYDEYNDERKAANPECRKGQNMQAAEGNHCDLAGVPDLLLYRSFPALAGWGNFWRSPWRAGRAGVFRAETAASRIQVCTGGMR
jgi:hypothetical protein